MAVGAVLATQLTTPTARAFGIFLDGFDVSGEPATPKRYGVPRQSIEVTETGRWGVSSMSFTVDDTALLVGVADGMEVRFEIFPTGGVAGIYFRGWISRYTLRPAFGEQGRSIDIEATGVEALLDWAVIPADITFASGSNMGAAIQSLVANAIGTGPLFVIGGNNGSSTTDQGMTQTVTTSNLTGAVTVTAGTSLGEAIRSVCARGPLIGGAVQTYVFTVDFLFSLRVYQLSQIAGVITSYRVDAGAITIVDTIAGTPAEGLTMDVTAASNRGVFIKGINAAGTGTIPDGSGKIGPYAYVSDDTSDSAVNLANVGRDYLARATTGANGHFDLTNVVPSTYVMPDGTLTITDARLNLVAQQYYIGPITRHFPGANLIDMNVSFGGPPPSGAALLRQLTRDQRL